MHICSRGASGHMGKIKPKLCLLMPFLGTHLQVRPVDGFTRMMAQTMRTLARICLFGFFHIAFHLGGQKPQFWGVNRRFQAKLAKSKNVHIIKTTASIPTKFCTVIKTKNALRGWSRHAHYKSKMADSRHLGKIDKSLYLGRS